MFNNDYDDTYEDEEIYDCDDEIEYTEDTIQDGLAELIVDDSDSFGIDWRSMRVRTFSEAGLLTYNKGLVILTPDGREFQLTIVQSR